MRLLPLQIPIVLILVVLVGSYSFGADRRPAAEGARFVLELDRDDKLTLNGKEIAREELVQEAARLTERVRLEAQDKGRRLDSERDLLAVMVLRADGETRFSTIYQMAMDCQAGGFRRWLFALKSGTAHAPTPRPSEEVVAPQPKEKSDLPAVLRTIPILLRADDRRLIGRVEVGERELLGFESLRAELVAILNDPDLPFDQALLKVDAQLRYAEVTRVINVLFRLNVTAISFSLAEAGDAP